ncbi:MAG: hypothetical protein D6737_06590 [Chloroflexi bacterium]|nr:MAG: hypothetical protein CUN54_08385 [Phototrophicales bacterium]RMF80904.1 MAG: hypothetical protein D6737_06590 [Chloroflexota bacterium]
MRKVICVGLISFVLLLLPAFVMAQDTAPGTITDPVILDLIDARLDLENLATNQLGSSRPTGWTNNGDGNSPSLLVDVRLDLELLANTVFGINKRPAEWFGASRTTREANTRDIRHDLEFLADSALQPNVRPPGWIGGDAILRCDRATQNLIRLLEQGGVFTLSVDPNLSNFCAVAAEQANLFVEVTLLSNPVGVGGGTSSTPTQNQGGGSVVSGQSFGGIRPSTNVTVGFLDRHAHTRIGVIPEDVTMTAVARSYTQFSNMAVMQGDGFEIFVDYTYTTLSDAQFEALPDVNNFNISPICEADWCTAPAPHRGFIPASSGFGGGQGGGGFGGQSLVPLDNIVIFYDGGDNEGTTLVRMQLCPQNTQGGSNANNCQPVTQVIGENGFPIPPVGSAGGIPQFRLPYGFSRSSARSASFFTADLWIAFPDER